MKSLRKLHTGKPYVQFERRTEASVRVTSCASSDPSVKIVLQMARRPDREKAEVLSEKDLKELRYNLAHLSVSAVRDFYEQAYQDCRLVYNRLPSPRKMQTLVQAWKQLRKWR